MGGDAKKPGRGGRKATVVFGTRLTKDAPPELEPLDEHEPAELDSPELSETDSEPEPPSRPAQAPAPVPVVGPSRVVRSAPKPDPTMESEPAPDSHYPERTSRGTLVMAEPRRSRHTTMYELSAVAERLSSVHAQARPSIHKQMALSFAISLTLVLLVTMIFVGGAWRVVLGVLAATGGTTLAVWAMLRSLPRIAKWVGPRELPGRPWMWLSGGALLLSGVTGLLMWSLSEVTASLAVVGVPEVVIPPLPTGVADDVEEEPARADDKMKRGKHVSLGDGVLFAPAGFRSADGHFDLIVHYHGNPVLVEQSVEAAKLNVLVHIINYGESSRRYSRPLSNPYAFDDMLTSVEARAEAKLGLATPRVERVALSSWSAGYGAVYHILRSRSRLDRIDALLMLDSLHANYVPGSKSKIQAASINPFVSFGKRATAGDKLMMLTHSAINTHGYPNTTDSSSALLKRLKLERVEVDPDTASPPAVKIEVAVRAFPAREKNWLRVHNEVHEGAFHLLGCSGKGKADHIAHLAQMSATVLPLLAKRWQ